MFCFKNVVVSESVLKTYTGILHRCQKEKLVSRALHPALRLAVALRYLAIGESQRSLSCHFRIGRSTVCQILNEVPEKIWEILSPLAVKVPEREDDWKKLAKDFWNLWGSPHCLGAIDGKHCVIVCPQNSGSVFCYYKGSFSNVLMAVADASYMFTYVDVGDYGRQCDSAVFNNSIFGRALNNNVLNVPHSDFLPATIKTIIITLVDIFFRPKCYWEESTCFWASFSS